MNQEQERLDGSGSGIAFVTGLFAGAVIGAGIGLLYAPRKGSELRGQISDAASSLGQTASKTADDVIERGRRLYGRARDAMSEAEGTVDQFAEAAQRTVDAGLSVARDTTDRLRQATSRE